MELWAGRGRPTSDPGELVGAIVVGLRYIRRWNVALGVGCALMLIGCSVPDRGSTGVLPTGGSIAAASPATSAARTPTASLTPTTAISEPLPRPSQLRAYPPESRSGVEVVDRLLAHLRQRDWSALAAMVDESAVPCEVPRPVSPQPRVCPAGKNPGDEIRGLWVYGIEAALWQDALFPLSQRFANAFSGATPALLAVRRDERTSTSNGMPASRWSVEMRDGDLYLTFSLSNNGLVLIAMDHGLGSLSPLLRPELAEWVLPPLSSGTAPAQPTAEEHDAIALAREFLKAWEMRDEHALQSMMSNRWLAASGGEFARLMGGAAMMKVIDVRMDDSRPVPPGGGILHVLLEVEPGSPNGPWSRGANERFLLLVIEAGTWKVDAVGSG